MQRINSFEEKSIKWQMFLISGGECNHCGGFFQYSQLIDDHIKPIALGGKQGDISNRQLLCYDCNRIKTKEDMQRIRNKRKLAAL